MCEIGQGRRPSAIVDSKGIDPSSFGKFDVISIIEVGWLKGNHVVREYHGSRRRCSRYVGLSLWQGSSWG